MTFKAEQQVSYKGSAQPATIISGPHETYGADRWLIRKADGKVTLAREAELEAIADRRTKVAQVAYEHRNRIPWARCGASSKRDYLAMADKVLAVLDAEAKPEKRALAEGDRIRIKVNRHRGANVLVGDVLTVSSVSGTLFYTNAPRKGYGRWVFQLTGEGTGWERV